MKKNNNKFRNARGALSCFDRDKIFSRVIMIVAFFFFIYDSQGQRLQICIVELNFILINNFFYFIIKICSYTQLFDYSLAS